MVGLGGVQISIHAGDARRLPEICARMAGGYLDHDVVDSAPREELRWNRVPGRPR